MGEFSKQLVVLETMPDHLRDSHRATGNWGTYPQNGAERRVQTLDLAEGEVDGDPDGYARIVREADSSDVERYGMAE